MMGSATKLGITNINSVEKTWVAVICSELGGWVAVICSDLGGSNLQISATQVFSTKLMFVIPILWLIPSFLDEFLDLSTDWFDFWSWLLRIACWPDSLLFSFQLLAVNFCLALVPCKVFHHFLSTILLPKKCF